MDTFKYNWDTRGNFLRMSEFTSREKGMCIQYCATVAKTIKTVIFLLFFCALVNEILTAFRFLELAFRIINHV